MQVYRRGLAMSRFSTLRAHSGMLSHSTVWMSGLSAFVLAGVAASTTWAAGVTDVVDAAEPDDPMDVNINIVTDMTFSSGLLVRENAQPPADGGAARTVDVREMQYQRQRYVLRPRIDVALFHNLGILRKCRLSSMNKHNFSLLKAPMHKTRR